MSGLLSLGEGEFLIASYPILTSNATGTSPGTLIMGRQFISHLADIVELGINIYPNNNDLSPELSKIAQRLTKDKKYHTQATNDEDISGYTILTDIDDKPSFLFELNTQRSIYQQGLKTLKYLIYTIIIVTLILGSLIIILMRSLVLNRIINLSQQVQEIELNKNLDKRIVDYKNDEITDLSQKINGMLSAIQNINYDFEEAMKKAEHASNAKTIFLSRMSHELRTPLNAVLGFAQLLELTHKDSSSEQDKSNINEILVAGRYLLDLINDLLDLARIEEGQYNLVISEHNIQDIIRSCTSMLAPIAADHGISISKTASHDMNYLALADHGALKQVLINLINNAIKYNRPNGHVTIDYGYTPDHRLIINVTDTGNGLPSSEIPNIFEPFTRLDQNSLTEGTGIGLAVCKKLIEMMNGEIGVENEVNNGCRFWIILPTSESIN